MKSRSPFFWLWSVSLALVTAATASAMTSCGNRAGGGFQDDDSSTSSGGSSSESSSSGGSTGSGGSSGGGDDVTASSSSGTSSGTSSSNSSSSAGSSSGSSSGIKDAGGDGHYVPVCGRPCDERSNTCCIPDDGGAAYCVSGTTANCGTNFATLHCSGASDCPSGEVCCGTYSFTALTAETACQRPGCPQQFCETNPECPSGVNCVAQTCFKATYYLCGLRSQSPFNCTAN